jgi:DNA-binding XRE family transcriptional regulator
MLREARMAAGMTQAEAAWTIGCASSYVSELESGRKAPSTVMAAEIIRAYKMDKRQAARLLFEAVDGTGRSRPSRRRDVTVSA